ncbi:N-acetyl-gamma-glutamyl-phosphate reductase [freshwater metagenome]|uniref:N-acetyl-gamma-glutamyl-phosphate reductase n=1 Tax=freshwater metagenome TaxID=449393 RepID=A0A094QPQ4_9ZZZZ
MRTAIVGASGYAGTELLRLLLVHPHFEPTVITAHSNAGELISSVAPQLAQLGDRRFEAFDLVKVNACELVFLALPHGESAALIAQLDPSLKIVDLGADFRLSSAEKWVQYYGGIHAGTWTYGLPELPGKRAVIAKSNRVANPGCYATSISLAIAPALGLVDTRDIVVVAASGTTGAGRSAKVNLLGSEVMGSLSSYKFGGVHQHTPEVEEALTHIACSDVKISFTPILAPMPRGILSTVTAKLTGSAITETIHALYTKAYAQDEFVTVLPIGQMPKTNSVIGSNHVQLQVAVDAHTNRLVVSAAIDNLGKGAAGQAIQNANLICGLPENTGLQAAGLGV